MLEMNCEHEMSHAEGKHTHYQVCYRLHTELKQLKSRLIDPKKMASFESCDQMNLIVGSAVLNACEKV